MKKIVMEEDEEFRPRTQTKLELARHYRPDAKPASARKRLMCWINYNEELKRELVAIGYRERSILLTAAQVRLIVKYLGEP